MSVMVLNTVRSFNINTAKFLSKITRLFSRIGYARAASELARMGYYKEAQNCIDMMKKL
jgi:hypothetical protein